MPKYFKFSDKEWIFDEKSSGENVKNWHDGNGVLMRLQCIGPDKELSDLLSDENAMREYFRANLAAQGVGVVECDSVIISGYPSARAIGKIVASGESAQYIASLSMPLMDRSFVLSLYSREDGMTGLRDAIVFDKYLSESGDDVLNDDGIPSGWACDPYFPEYKGPSLRNNADSEEYDSQFPEHPLSKVRSKMNQVCKSINIVDVEEVTPRPWWKFWG
ncbi:hypothetical protein [Microbulbifer pacificus]|uniref:Uncharacterized protein n=1 Tax=Microbulbifer pacificus TaxID=407164 RepID=A0AAU0MZU4_9GAMM|nr:hypothetical protein [Microbulbifer pacificus]WOX06131.1 hypothetical protein R5R33_03060 [Microbulbifer pacificus]